MGRTDRVIGSKHRLAVPVAVVALLAAGGSMTWQATADPGDDTPSEQQVRSAESAATDAGRDVAAVRAELAVANHEAEQAGIRTAAAYEAWNAARWEAREAEKQAAAAAKKQRQATAELARRRTDLDALLVGRYESAPELSALGAIAGEDSVDGVLARASAWYGTSSAVKALEAEEAAAAELARLATDEAEQAEAHAQELADDARAARNAAEAAEQAALAQAEAVATRKERLVAEMARLQGVSVALATKRQNALEERARVRAREAAEKQAGETAQAEQTDQTDEAPAPEPRDDTSDDPQPAPEPTPTPPPSGSVSAVIAFAKAQIGDRYVWGAAGPDSWDCSGLVMGAWQKGGTSLPHYSAGQYAASTPIASGDLRPGDLVFWGSSSDPSSIHHVALYVGNGQIVHAPRTGRPVTQESMYYWIPPNFFARP